MTEADILRQMLAMLETKAKTWPRMAELFMPDSEDAKTAATRCMMDVLQVIRTAKELSNEPAGD